MLRKNSSSKMHTFITQWHDGFSVAPVTWLQEMDESESGQMVLEKVKWILYRYKEGKLNF